MNPKDESIREKILKRQLLKDNEKLANAVVSIFGCGGLGSNIAMMLARAGIESFHLFDFDKVDYSNLNRQYYMLSDIGRPKVDALKDYILQVNPDIKVNTYNIKLDSENIEEYIYESDVYIEAFDDKLAKTMLFDVFSNLPATHLISASGVSGIEYEDVSIKNISNIRVVGDFHSDESMGLYSPKVNLIASIQALEALKIILKGDKDGQI